MTTLAKTRTGITRGVIWGGRLVLRKWSRDEVAGGSSVLRHFSSDATGASLRKVFQSSAKETLSRIKVTDADGDTNSANSPAYRSPAQSKKPRTTSDVTVPEGYAERAKVEALTFSQSDARETGWPDPQEEGVALPLASSPPAPHLEGNYMELAPRITVVGCGGAGGNAVSNMISHNLKGVEFMVCNTDAQHLSTTLTDNRIHLGRDAMDGLGCGANPDLGRQAAIESKDEILKMVSGSNMVFITAGMGGGTGTGAAPVIAEACMEAGILTIAVVTTPFFYEGRHRMRLAQEGIQNLQRTVDSLIVIPNQNLFALVNKTTSFQDAFRIADDVLLAGVRSVTDLMVNPGLINLDFADVRTVMAGMGNAIMGSAEAKGDGRAVRAAESALSNPLLGDTSIRSAKGVLVNITGGADMTLFEVDNAARKVTDQVEDETANIIFGSTYDSALEGSVRVSVVATGIDNTTLGI